jgi:hypothetical protein
MAAGLILIAVYLLLERERAAPVLTEVAEVETVIAPGGTDLTLPLAAVPVAAGPTATVRSEPTPPTTATIVPTAIADATATPLPAPSATGTATAVPPVSGEATAKVTLKATVTVTATAVLPLPAAIESRLGVSGAMSDVAPARAAGLPFGHYLNWNFQPHPERPGDVVFWQTVRINEEGPWRSWDEIARSVAAQPGSIWIVGNEPDVDVQDNVSAARYADVYHEVYTFIKERDATARIAIAGVAQPTPLRLVYLDLVLDTYRARHGVPLPVDVWTVHAFILREQRDSWGAGIPPGMEQESGAWYEVADHDDLAIFAENLVAFRAWMAERGYQERPLAVTEFGILMPEDYGFPPDLVAAFLHGALDFMLTAANETGYPADDGRLVQWSFWYSLYDRAEYPTGNLFDRPNGRLTSIGEAFAAYARQFEP